MKVLVLGGTGAMGKHVVQLLAQNAVETVVTSRKKWHSEGTVRYVQGNAHDIEFLCTLLQERWDAIIDFMAYTTSSFEKRVNLLLDATSQYIFISSARVYADVQEAITEKSLRLLDISLDKDFLSTDDYSLRKARQENSLMRSGRKNWTIIRPYITYSENRLQLGVLEKEEWLYRALHNRTIVFSKEIALKITTLTYGLDVAKGIIAVLGNSKTVGETFHITMENHITWNDVLSIYIDVMEEYLGKKPKVLFLDLNAFMKGKHDKYQVKYDRLYNRCFNNSKISNYVDVENFTQVSSGLRKCLEGFLQNPRFNKINWTKEALKDRETNEYTSFKEIPGFKEKVRYLIIRFFYGFVKAPLLYWRMCYDQILHR